MKPHLKKIRGLWWVAFGRHTVSGFGGLTPGMAWKEYDRWKREGYLS